MKSNLTGNGINHIADFAGNQAQFGFIVFQPPNQILKSNHFGKNRSHFRQNFWGLVIQIAAGIAQDVVAAVSQFMRQGQDIAFFAVKIQQQVRMRHAAGSGTKSAALFARARRYVNPGIFKKAAADFLKFLGKRAISVQNRFYRLLPADALVFGKRQRRIAIPILDFINTEPTRF